VNTPKKLFKREHYAKIITKFVPQNEFNHTYKPKEIHIKSMNEEPTKPKAIKKKVYNEIRDCAYIVLGMMFYALGFVAFILPHHVVIGGMAGFSSLIFYATGQHIPIAVIMYVSNIILLACGFKFLGRGFVIRTIFGATVLSLLIGAIEHYFNTHPPLITDPTMSVIMGAMLCGVGIGLYYSHHGTAGGTDIVAAIMSKLSNVSVGRVMMAVDMTIVACSFFLPFDGDIEARTQVRTQIIIYGWLSIFLYSFITDKLLSDGMQTIQFIIISENWTEIAERITHETGRGVTTWQGQGFWTGEDRRMMLVWARKTNAEAIMRIAHEVDPSAYITHSYVRSVYGNGFDTLTIKRKK
jgi:uncharacterized membrane-anchored protein YitT (DUF2179 family)